MPFHSASKSQGSNLPFLKAKRRPSSSRPSSTPVVVCVYRFSALLRTRVNWRHSSSPNRLLSGCQDGEGDESFPKRLFSSDTVSSLAIIPDRPFSPGLLQ